MGRQDVTRGHRRPPEQVLQGGIDDGDRALAANCPHAPRPRAWRWNEEVRIRETALYLTSDRAIAARETLRRRQRARGGELESGKLR
jgi:hypothetical protein